MKMTNIKSLGDYVDKDDQGTFSFAGGHNSAIGIDNGGSHVVNLYADGFTVDNGPFRPLSEPQNSKFLSDIKSGIAPPEFQDGNNEVSIRLIDHQNTRFIKEDVPYEGNNSSRPKLSSSSAEYRLGEINTNLRIKLHTGDLVNLTISQDATVNDLLQFISQNTGVAISNITLMSGFPPRKIVPDGLSTLKDADILNCTLIQKLNT